MPTYDYQCQKCASLFEVSHSIGEFPSEGCPRCGSLEIKKSVSGFYLGNSSKGISSASKYKDMKADLSENYGIESVNMRNGSFEDLYKGIKKDGSRVKEQMLAGAEKQQEKVAKKNREFLHAPAIKAKTLDRIIQKRSTGAIRKG